MQWRLNVGSGSWSRFIRWCLNVGDGNDDAKVQSWKTHGHKIAIKETCYKEMKNAPSALLSYISTRDFFKITKEVLRKHEPQANALRISRVFLKIPRAHITQQCTRNKVFICFIKCIVSCARTDDVGSVHYLRNRKHVPCFYRVIETRVEVWEN